MGAMRIGMCAGGLALAIALLLAPEAARAQTPTDGRNHCGANSGSSLSCTAAAYARGIIYWDQTNAVTLTVPGTATTATITASTTADGSLDNGITIRTAVGTGARNIMLTVGSANNFVNIVQGPTPDTNAWYNNHGILVSPRAADSSTVTVDVKSGVTIGAANNKMRNQGIDVSAVAGAGAVSVTSAATIYSENQAIYIVNSGAAATTVVNSGALTSDTRGIHVSDQGSAGAVTVTNSGAITSESTTGHEGIFARTSGTGKDTDGTNAGVSVTHSAGTVSVPGGAGIKAHVGMSRQETDAGHGDYVVPRNKGLVKVDVTGGSVASKGNAVEAINFEAGSVEVMIAAGATLTSTESYGIDARLLDVGNTAGTVSVTSAGAVTAETESGIHAQNAVGNANAVTVAVTGGSVSTEGQSKAAVAVLQHGTGDAVASVSSGAALTSKHNAGIYATLSHVDNAAGQVKVTQGGTIAGRKGVYARAARDSVVTIAAGTTTSETRAAQPLIDVTWTGSFSHGTSVTVAQNDDDRFLANGVAHAIAIAQEVETEKAIRYGSAAGIEAQVMSWRAVMTQVAKGDDPGAFADAAAVTALFDDGADAATKAQAAAVIAAFRAALSNPDLDDMIPGAAAIDTDSTTGLSDTEIETYLSVDAADRRTLLRNVLAQSLSDEEKAVLRAVATDTGLTDAVLDAALPANAMDEQKMAYRDAVRAWLKRHNVGDIRVAMTGGSIASRGDGIRAYYATPHANNGAIDVTIAAGATVTGADAGVYVANAGATGAGMERTLKQTVTVNGMVTGGTDAAVHLVGGGRLTVGEGGKLMAGRSGRAILVNEPGRAVIEINGEVTGGPPPAGTDPTKHAVVHLTGGGQVTVGLTGYVRQPDTDRPTRGILAEGEPVVVQIVAGGTTFTQKSVRAAAMRVTGGYGGNISGIAFDVVDTSTAGPLSVTIPVTNGELDEESDEFTDLPTGEPPTLRDPSTDEDPPEDPREDPRGCNDGMEERCRVYEALPSALLAMNGLPSYGERMAAARDGFGGWARVDGAGGEWKAKSSTQRNMAFDYRRYGVQAGVDFAAGEDGRIGMSVRGLQGSAEMTASGGEVELSGIGAGVHGTAFLGDGFHVDAQAMATRYDVKLTAPKTGGKEVLKDGAKGRGYALGVEIGRRTDMGDGLAVTPAVGLTWSEVSLSFTEAVDDPDPVSVEDARSLLGRVGLRVETRPSGGPRLFGSVEATHEFSDERTAKVDGATLKTTEARKTGVRVGFGGEHGWEDGRYALRGAAGYALRGSGNGEFDGGLSLAIRF